MALGLLINEFTLAIKAEGDTYRRTGANMAVTCEFCGFCRKELQTVWRRRVVRHRNDTAVSPTLGRKAARAGSPLTSETHPTDMHMQIHWSRFSYLAKLSHIDFSRLYFRQGKQYQKSPAKLHILFHLHDFLLNIFKSFVRQSL